jgi:REP element-mobilizing transposase RayT
MHFARRHLPHLYELYQPLFVTFRLHGSLPAGREFPKLSMTSGKAFVCMDRLLGSHCAGPTYLRMPAIAGLVVDAVEQGSLSSYLLHAWVVMPNHVHLLITPHSGVPKLLQKLKGSTARAANKLLGQTGRPFWQEESYDHLVRNSDEFARIENYIVQNPVQAGLARTAEEYLWSSASSPGGLKPAAG